MNGYTWITLLVLWPLGSLAWTIALAWQRHRALRSSETRPTPHSALPAPFSTLQATEIRVRARRRLTSHLLHNTATIAQTLAIPLLELYVVNAGYQFRHSLQPLGTFRFVSTALAGDRSNARPGNRFANTAIGSIPSPLPADYLLGIDAQRYDFERGKWSYLRGHQKYGGWWYYPLYALAVKMPLGTLALFALLLSAVVANAFGFRGRSLPRFGAARAVSIQDTLALVVPGLSVLLLVVSQFGFSRYLRYSLPCFPFAYIWLSQLATCFTRVTDATTVSPTVRDNAAVFSAVTRPAYISRCARILRLRAQATAHIPRYLVALSLLWSTTSVLSVYPHELSYFNEAAGGPLNGIAHLADANVDWGQGLRDLNRWCRNNPAARPLFVVYFGFVDPIATGIPADWCNRTTQKSHPARDAEELVARRPGWYAISLNELHGYRHSGDHADEHAWLRSYPPVAILGYSMRVYHVST